MQSFHTLSKQTKIFSVGLGLLVFINLLAAWPKPSTQTTEVSKPLTKQAVVQASTIQSFLTIREWGVKLPLNSSLVGLRYVVSGNEVRFYTVQLASYGCQADSHGLPRGLMRTKQQQIGTATSDSIEPSFRKLGDHWFSLTGSQAACFDRALDQVPPAVMASYERLADALEPALRQIQPV